MRINRYHCSTCGDSTFTEQRDEGVAPFQIVCPHCTGPAYSSFYAVPRSARSLVSHEFYRPTAEEYARLSRNTQDHVDRGGLLLRARSVTR